AQWRQQFPRNAAMVSMELATRIDRAERPERQCATMSSEVISLIVPTRQRPDRLRRLLASLADTTARPEALEVILVIDSDDADSLQVTEDRLASKHVVVPSGQTMGALNMAGYDASRGRYLMLLNDDVIARTPGWDNAVRSCFAAYPDEILLVHVNDL